LLGELVHVLTPAAQPVVPVAHVPAPLLQNSVTLEPYPYALACATVGPAVAVVDIVLAEIAIWYSVDGP
jgi:hypothetical protein